MSVAQEILSNVQLDPQYRSIETGFDQNLGFVCTDAGTAEDPSVINLIGFTGDSQTYWRFGNSIRSVTKFDNLPENARTIDKQGKGVGTRMYNTPQGLSGTKEGKGAVDVYTFQIDPERILDLRRESGIKTVIRHAGHMVMTRVQGLEPVVNGIHSSFGNPEDVDAVLYKQPPRACIRQGMRGARNPKGVPGAFLLIRNHYINMHKIGEYKA